MVKENNPIPYIFTTEEYSKRLSFFFPPPFDGSISFESSWHQEIKLLNAECVPRIGRIFSVVFYCCASGFDSLDSL